MTKKLVVPFVSLLALSAAGQAPHVPYSNQPILSESTTKISDHVWWSARLDLYQLRS